MLLIGLMAVSCQSQDENEGVGYLKLQVEADTYIHPNTRIINEYNPKQIAVKIVNASGETVREYDDYTAMPASISLTPGTYTIYASSNGFDGNESGFDIPYYAGSTQVTLTQGTSSTARITCTLANVKVTVNYDQSFIDGFASAKSVVSSAVADINPLTFTMGETTKSGYFPVGNLTAALTVVNKKNTTHSRTDQFLDIEARDHLILNYRIAPNGTIGGITVTVDGTETIYTISWAVSTEAKTSLTATPATDIWSSFATLNGVISATEEGKTLDATCMKFEYKLKDATDWNSVAATSLRANTEGLDAFSAKISGLTAGKEYLYRLSYSKGTDSYQSSEATFKTDTENKIPNLSMDNWMQDGKHKYMNASWDDFFWDSGNEGANTIKEINPTCPEETIVVSGKAAKLWSTTAGGQFAAGSLFTGDFGSASIAPLGAKLSFGRPFTERPSQMTGYYRYTPGSINKSKLSAVQTGQPDTCSVYIALCDWTAPFAVSTGDNTFVNFSADYIIAYGSLQDAGYDVSPTTAMDAYKEFSIDIKYRDLQRKPTYILIVCSSSKYGDYFTGSTSSVLYLDEFDFKYGEPVIDEKYIK